MFGIEVPHAMPCDKSQSKWTKLHGVYDFAHPRGVFEVHLRSGGRFFAPKFPEKSKWKCTNECCADGKTCCHLQIEWGKYGQYALEMDEASVPPCCSGSVKGNPENWRKMTMKRPFTPQELKLMDSEWTLEHPGGSFAVEFHADGLNSFVCNMFPTKASWSVEDAESGNPTVFIHWGKYGEYELKMAPDGESMAGSAKGNPAEWRRAARLWGLDKKPLTKRGREEACGGCKKGCGECGRED